MNYLPYIAGGAAVGLAARVARGVSRHIWYQGGKQGKTVCTSHAMAYFGICASGYKYSAYMPQMTALLRKNGWSARSRKSKLRKGESVGAARKLIAQHTWGDPPGTSYLVGVPSHVLVINYDGETVVDTDPRVRDRRKVSHIYAVFPNPSRER